MAGVIRIYEVKLKLSCREYTTKLEHLYDSQVRGKLFNPETIEMEHKSIFRLNWSSRKRLYDFLLKKGRKDLVDFFEDNYLIRMDLGGQGLVGRINSITDLPVAYAIELYELSVKKKQFNYADWNSYHEYFRGLSREEKRAVYMELNKVYPDAANYFSQKFMFRNVALNIPI